MKLSSESKIIIIGVVLLIALEALSIFVWTSYPSADMFYNEMTVDAMLNGGDIPLIDDSIIGGRIHSYPPLMDVYTAYAMQVTGFGYALLTRMMSFLILLSYFFISYSIARIVSKNFRTAFFTGILFSTCSFVAFQYASIHAGPTLGILVSLFAFWEFLRFKERRDNASLAAFSLFVFFLPYLHYRSFILTWLILGTYILCSFIRSRSDAIKSGYHKVLAVGIVSAIIAAPWYLTRFLSFSSLGSLENPFLSGVSSDWFILLLAALVATSTYLLAKHWNRAKKNDFMVFWALVPALLAIVLFFKGSSTYYRNLEYAAFPLFFLLSYIASYLSQRKKLRIAIPTLIIAFAVIQALGVYMAEPMILEGDLPAFTWLAEQSNGTVLSDFRHAYTIANLVDKQVIVGAFPESIPDGQERLDDLWTFFNTCELSERMDIIADYHVKYVFIGQTEKEILECPEQLSSFDEAYSSDGVTIYTT